MMHEANMLGLESQLLTSSSMTLSRVHYLLLSFNTSKSPKVVKRHELIYVNRIEEYLARHYALCKGHLL